MEPRKTSHGGSQAEPVSPKDLELMYHIAATLTYIVTLAQNKILHEHLNVVNSPRNHGGCIGVSGDVACDGELVSTPE